MLRPVLHGLKSPGIFQYVVPLENEHDLFREVHLSLVYEVSFIRLQATVVKVALFSPSFCTITITHRHTCP